MNDDQGENKSLKDQNNIERTPEIWIYSCSNYSFIKNSLAKKYKKKKKTSVSVGSFPP